MALRWHHGAFGVAIVVAFLSLSPMLCSAWTEEREFVEQQGNISFLCKSSGPCISCSHSETEANKFHCHTTGYHQSFKCLEMKSVQKVDQTKHDLQHQNGDETPSKDDRQIETEQTKFEVIGPHKRRLMQDTALGDRKVAESKPVFKFQGGLKMYNSFRSCKPVEMRIDRFTVLQFEVIAVASLVVCSPLVYYRRKHSFSGMTRVPTNPRF